jgi:hypothetical protein
MRLTSIDWRALADLPTLQRRVAQAPTFVWAIAVLVLPLVAGGFLVAARHAERLALSHDQAARAELAQLRARVAAGPPADSSPFALRLPLSQPSARAVAHLREAAEAQSVLVTAISAAHQAPTGTTLGRMSLDVQLRGSYVAIKTVLADVLTRDAQQAVLQQLSLRRANPASPAGMAPMGAMNPMNAARPVTGMTTPPGGDLEARVVATWLSRPLAEPASTSAPQPLPAAKPATQTASVASGPATAAPASASAPALAPSAASAAYAASAARR